MNILRAQGVALSVLDAQTNVATQALRRQVGLEGGYVRCSRCRWDFGVRAQGACR